MSDPDIQYFPASGTWRKPSRAVAVDVILCGAGAGAGIRGSRWVTPGEDGQLTVQRIPADELPDEVAVNIGSGGRPGGRDGYGLIVTHLEES